MTDADLSILPGAGPMLAQSLSNQNLTTYLLSIAGVVALLVLAGAGVMMYRKRLFRAESEIGSAGSMFDELHRLRREGLMTEEEYTLARKKLATRASEAMDRRAAERAAAQGAKSTPRPNRPR